MPTPTVCIARIINTVEARRRRLYHNAVYQLISAQSPIIPLYPCRHCRVLLYKPSEFQLYNYTDDWCIEFLQFSRQEIKEILPFLYLDLCSWHNQYHSIPEAAFCLVLYKLS